MKIAQRKNTKTDIDSIDRALNLLVWKKDVFIRESSEKEYEKAIGNMAYCSVAHNRFRHPCQNRIATLADGSASDVHLRTDLPKNKPTVSFLKATTAYLTLRAVEYLPASKGRSAPHNLPMEPKGSPSEDYSTSASPFPVSQRNP